MSSSGPDVEPDSPCIQTCVMDSASGFCTGCKRTIEEIIAWRDYSTSEKRAVLELLPQRTTAVTR